MGLNHRPLDWQPGALPRDHRSPLWKIRLVGDGSSPDDPEGTEGSKSKSRYLFDEFTDDCVVEIIDTDPLNALQQNNRNWLVKPPQYTSSRENELTHSVDFFLKTSTKNVYEIQCFTNIWTQCSGNYFYDFVLFLFVRWHDKQAGYQSSHAWNGLFVTQSSKQKYLD